MVVDQIDQHGDDLVGDDDRKNPCADKAAQSNDMYDGHTKNVGAKRPIELEKRAQGRRRNAYDPQENTAPKNTKVSIPGLPLPAMKVLLKVNVDLSLCKNQVSVYGETGSIDGGCTAWRMRGISNRLAAAAKHSTAAVIHAAK